MHSKHIFFFGNSYWTVPPATVQWYGASMNFPGQGTPGELEAPPHVELTPELEAHPLTTAEFVPAAVHL